MKKRKVDTFLILIGIVMLSGCKTAPVYNIKESEFTGYQQVTLFQVGQAIIRGAKRAGWRPKPVNPGKITADYAYKRNRYKASVDINYDLNSYDITYRSSSNLKFRDSSGDEDSGEDFFSEYNPFKGDNSDSSQTPQKIHKIYNQWVKALEQKINIELAALPVSTALTTSPSKKQVKSTCYDKPEKQLSGQATVTRPKVNVRTGASTGCSTIGIIKKGETFSLIGIKDNWYYIATAQGNNAWIYAPLVRKMELEMSSSRPPEPASTVAEASLPPVPPAPPVERISIAVIQFKTLNKEAQDIALGELVSETFTSALVNSSAFKITERDQLDKVIKEMEMSQTGFIETTDAVEIGKMLHADAIITGSVALLGNQIQLNARIIDIESAYVISAETKTSTYTLQNINKMINDIVKNLARKFNKSS